MTEASANNLVSYKLTTDASRSGAMVPRSKYFLFPQETESSGMASVFSEPARLLEKQIGELRIPPSPGSMPVVERSLEERLFDATAGVKILTSRVAMHLDREWRNRLFRQLDSLHEPEEWEPRNEPVQGASFATFLKAIVGLQPKKRPGLGLSQAGHLIAAWTNGSDRLTIEFLGNDRVRWVIGRRDEDGQLEQIAGHVNVAALAVALSPYNPNSWFSA